MTLVSIVSARETTTERLYLKDGLRIWNNEPRGMLSEPQVKSYSVILCFCLVGLIYLLAVPLI